MKKILLVVVMALVLCFQAVPVYAANGSAGDACLNAAGKPDDTLCDGALACISGKCAVDPSLDAPAAATPAPAAKSGSGGPGSLEFVPLLPSLPGLAEAAKQTSLAPFLSQVYKICIGLAAVLAVLQIMRAGILYMGGDSITEKKEARALIGTALAGLLLVLSPVIVFTIINPKILQLDINAKDLQTSVPASGSAVDTSGSPNPQVTAKICASSTTKKAVVLGSGQTCDAAVGRGYAKVDDQCCSGLAAGASCCAYSPTNDQNISVDATNAANAGSGTFTYTLDSKDTNVDTGAACKISETSKKYPTLAACTTEMNTFAARSGYVLSQSCNGSYPDTPAATWNSIKSLPRCPQ